MPGTQKSTQKTLFQTWKKKDPAPISTGSGATRKSQNLDRKNRKTFSVEEAVEMAGEPIDLTDDDLLEAAMMMETTMEQNMPGPSRNQQENIESIPGFDNSAGQIWIYPTNYPVRSYQYSIVRNSLFKNTLVSLPTGLGKTFIAAVVMYNFYRWYPQGKIVFMAPTKPLVSQQIEACYKIMGIPMDDQAEITGMSTPVHKREALWTSKRVFFLTPQVINNDLARGVCPVSQIKCVVIDEAHKAQGKHAYCQVVNQIASSNRNFRVLALSATPGTDVKSVQLVITNLLISHIEIRSEDSIDIQQFSHKRNVEKVVCKLDETITKMKDNFLKVVEIFTKSLVNKRALFDRDPSRYSKYGLLMARDQFRKDPPTGLNKYEMGAVEGEFATCISLYHGLDLLLQHGMRSFFIFLKSMMEGDKGNMRAKSVLGANSLFREIYSDLKGMFGDSPNPLVLLTQAGQAQQSMLQGSSHGLAYVYSHPKMAKLEEVVVKHFQDFTAGSENDATRVMVFCQYRDSVQEITELLQKHRPLIRPMQFVGHSTASGKIAKFTQKDQLQVVSKFRTGGYNTLVSTCVGEEGLDIGDVDLIVCFDAHKSPIRLVQRMGRTGRKRKGRIVMLVTEGKEERDYNSSVSNKKSIQKAITGNSSRSLQFYQYNPRMVPIELNPEPYKMFITVKPHLEGASAMKGKKKKLGPAEPDISLMMKNAEQQNTVFLNHQQAREWNEKMKLSAKEKEKVKVLPTAGHMLSLKSQKQHSTSFRRSELSLSGWSAWQNRLQFCGNSGHSTVTKNFVEIMEIFDLVKQSDDDNFEENLAPFLGGKYDKERMESKNKSKIDTFLTPKRKEQKILEKIKKNIQEAESGTKIQEKVRPTSPPLSSDADFVTKPLKKVFPPKNLGFRNKLSMFSATDEADFEAGLGTADDDTLTGIDSILPDPNIVMESSNEITGRTKASEELSDVRETKGPKREKMPEECGSQNERNCDLRSVPMGDFSTDVGKKHPKNQPILEKSGKGVEPVAKSKGVDSFIAAEDGADQNQNRPNTSEKPSSYLGFVDNLSSLATPAATRTSGATCDVLPSIVRIPTPPSFDSISLDFLDDLKNMDSDDEVAVKRKTRACFQLGGESEIKMNKPTTSGGKQATTGNFRSNLTEEDGRASDRVSLISNADKTCSENRHCLPSAGRATAKPTCETAILVNAEEIANGFVSCAVKQEKQILPNSPENSDVVVSCSPVDKVLNATASPMNTSADMFASQLDINFDFGDVFAMSQVEEGSEVTSPMLLDKRQSGSNRSKNGTLPENSLCFVKRESSESDVPNDSLAKSTLTQRSENRALFADLPRLQSDDKVLVAKVKPQRASRGEENAPEMLGQLFSAPLSDNEDMDDDDFIADFVLEPVEGQPDGSVKRKRRSPEPAADGFQAKRRKNLNYTDVSLLCDTVPVMKTPEVPIPVFNMHTSRSTESEESPLVIKKKRNPNRVKILFSQEISSPSHRSVEDISHLDDDEPDVSKKKIGVLGQLGAEESPINFPRGSVHGRNLLAEKNQHSTPKCVPLLSDDDDFMDEGLAFLKSKRSKTQENAAQQAKNAVTKSRVKHRLGDFVEDEAEVSNNGVEVSSDEVEHDDTQAMEEMRDFVNDATQLTQHVGDASSVDEHAMYLRGPPGLFKERPRLEAHGGKFKLAFDVGKDLDVFSQEQTADISGYEEDSFICDEVEHEDLKMLGEVTLLQDISDASHPKKRVTRRQAELHKLRKMNYDVPAPAEKKNEENMKKDAKQERKRIVCMDDSIDSVETCDQTGGPEKLKSANDSNEKWTCAACTLLNPKSSQICDLCDSERPVEKSAKRPNQSSSNSIIYRTCKMCTYINRSNENSCEMCGENLEKTVIVPKADKTDKPKEHGSVSDKIFKISKALDPVAKSTPKIIKSETERFGGNPSKSDADHHWNHSPLMISATPILKGNRPAIRKRLDVSSFSMTEKASTSQMSNCSTTSSNCETREERIRRSKMKQMEFKAKLARRQSQQSFSKPGNAGASGESSGSNTTKAMSKSRDATNAATSAKMSLQFASPARDSDLINSSISTPLVRASSEKDKKVILIDSKELSSSQPIITSLRCKHKVHIVVASLPHCDYIIGKGTAVERKVFSDFSQVSNRQKLVSRLQQLNANYNRVYLIIEQDRPKKNDMSGGQQVHSSYYQSTICSLTQTNVRIMHSDNQDATASILHSLVSKEKSQKRGIDFEASEKASDPKCRSLLKMYTSVPRVSFVSALYMCLNYKTFKEVASSSVEKLIQRAHLSTSSAAEVYNFFRRSFDLQMTPSK